MKIAVCFSGQIRTGHVVAPNIKRYLGDLIEDCDVFVHTWDTTCISQHDYRFMSNHPEDFARDANITRPVDPEVVQAFKDAWQPISMTVEPYNNTLIHDTYGGRRFNETTQRWGISMFESLYKANQLKKDQEEQQGFKYDYVIRCRPDLIFHQDKSLASDIALITDTNMISGNPNQVQQKQNRIEDIFWIATSANMDNIADFYYVRMNDTGVSDAPNDFYRDWQADLCSHIIWGHHLSVEDSTINNYMRIYYHGDMIDNVDVLDPKFATFGRIYDNLGKISEEFYK